MGNGCDIALKTIRPFGFLGKGKSAWKNLTQRRRDAKTQRIIQQRRWRGIFVEIKFQMIQAP
jgi:hypothetical protein